MTTTTPSYTPGQAAALAAALSPNTMDLLGLSVPLDMVRRVHAELAKNPKDGPRYLERNQHECLRHSYALAGVHAGITVAQAGLIDATCDTSVFDYAREMEAQSRAEGRLSRFDMTHDITEFAQAVESSAEWVSRARKARSEREEDRRSSHKAESLTDLHAYYGPPKWQVRHLVRALIRRWLPAMQNIVSRLPPGERQAAADDASARLRDALVTLAKLHSMTRTASDEYRRWKLGFGAVDMAVIQGAAMVGYAIELANRMVDSDAASDIRRRAREARATMSKALGELAWKRFDVVGMHAWRHKKADMAEFARKTGGIGPELEVLYHSRGSKFAAY